MNKKELTAQVANKTGMTHSLSAKVIDSVLQSISESLEKGEAANIRKFGSFSVVRRAERNGVNPMTKEVMIIPARKVIRFTPSPKIVLK